MAFQPVPTYADPVEVNPRSGKSEFSPTWLSWFLTLSNGGLSSTVQHNSLLGLQGGVSGQYYHLTTAQLAGIPFRSAVLPAAIVLTGSVFTYHNADAYDEDVIFQGGTITKIEFSRDGTTWYDTGVVAGMIRLSVGDRFRITYTGSPNATKVPR